MGASGWNYFVPYKPDINQALQELRQQVFESGDYFLLGEDQPSTIDELLDSNEDAGTHSIIDMYEGVASEPKWFAVAPFTNDQLNSLFGTPKPTRDQVKLDDVFLDKVYQYRDVGEGAYIILYKDDQPDEILFLGASGD